MRSGHDEEGRDLPVWLDESSQTSTEAADDLLETDDPLLAMMRSRTARLGALALLLLVLATAIVWRVVDRPGTKPVAAPSTEVRSSVAIHPAPQRSSPAVHSFGSGVIAEVLGQSRRTVADYVRQTSPRGACRLAPVGRTPAQRIKHALVAAFPELRQVRIGSTLDEYTALCAITARAIFREAVVTLSITAPKPRKDPWRFARLETGILTTGAVTTEYALSVSRTGWRVLVGASGPAEALPGSNELLRFAQKPQLTW